ncbi:response regulator transcription factor [Ferrovibrio sp. MS7]|uniref:response regulator transcription factor n=1 Tax=Ferrovibrio plantarum TaxID=3119164 RepID=UPI0031372D8C
MAGPNLLVVDDSPVDRQYLHTALTAAGYQVTEVENAAAALNELRGASFDLMLLDLVMPEVGGLDLLKQLPERRPYKVIVVSGHEDTESKVAALDAGAVDYVTKPYDLGELLARVRAALRREAATEESDTVRAGILSVSKLQHVAMVGQRQVRLSVMQYRLLVLLATRAGQVVPLDAIAKELWNHDGEHERQSLRVLVKKLRDKIEPNPARAMLLQTEPGIGYRLKAEA